MTNLIPPTARTQVRREYWMRTVSVWFFLLGAACITVIILNVPLYVLILNQLVSFKTEYEKTSIEVESFNASEKSITNATTIAKLLSSTETTESVMSVVSELEVLAGEGVHINHYAVTRTDGSLYPITISGLAVSRLTLSEFRTRLESTPKFATAKLPLSNFAKDKDIPFSITIVSAEAEKKEAEKKKGAAKKP